MEGKNVIRKHIGYGHIPAGHGEAVQKFYTAHLNPYLNFHRPCGFAIVPWMHGASADRSTHAKTTPHLPEAEESGTGRTIIEARAELSGLVSNACAR